MSMLVIDYEMKMEILSEAIIKSFKISRGQSRKLLVSLFQESSGFIETHAFSCSLISNQVFDTKNAKKSESRLGLAQT